MSSFRDFSRAGHWPSLLGAFLYFDFSFMVWVMLGALGVFIAQDLGLSPSQKGLLVAIPLLGGSVFRIFLGSLVDRHGPKKVSVGALAITALPLLAAWQAPPSYGAFLAVGFLLGLAGASFAAALPLAGRWYPPQHQGLALGLAGAGNSGTVIAAFFAPRLAEVAGWQAVFGWLLLPWMLVLAALMLLAREPPAVPATRSGWERWRSLFAEPDTWWYCLRYAVTFGGFVGLASFMPIFLHDQYGVPRLNGGSLTAACVLAGAFLRPVGGLMADRFGGGRVLAWVYAGVGALSVLAAFLLPLYIQFTVLFLLLGLLGIGNGAIFQRVPQRFGVERLGSITGLMGAMGGVGGFMLPALLGSLKQHAGSFSAGFSFWGAAALLAWTLPPLVRAFRFKAALAWMARAEP